MRLYHGNTKHLATTLHEHTATITGAVYGGTIPEEHLEYLLRITPTTIGLRLAPALTHNEAGNLLPGDLLPFSALTHAYDHLRQLSGALHTAWHTRPPSWRTKITRLTLNATAVRRNSMQRTHLAQLLNALPHRDAAYLLVDEPTYDGTRAIPRP